MKEASSSTIIDAPVTRVWTSYFAFSVYSEWNPVLLSVAGEAKRDNKLKVTVKTLDGTVKVFTVKVIELEENRSLIWRAGIPGLAMSEHYFLLRNIDGSKTLFSQGERFYGLLSLMNRTTLRQIEEQFASMNLALKVWVERGLGVNAMTDKG